MRLAEVRPLYRIGPADDRGTVPVAYLNREETEALKRTATLADALRGRLIDRYSEFGDALAQMAGLALRLAYAPEVPLEEELI